MFFCIFNKHAPIKRKYFLANEAPFMTKGLHKVIKKKSRLRNKFLKTKSITDWENQNVQRNYCEKLLRSAKTSYFNNLDISKTNGNRFFWKTIVPFKKKKLKKRKIRKVNLFFIMIYKYTCNTQQLTKNKKVQP